MPSLKPVGFSGASYFMSLLVLDPDIAQAEGLCRQLTDLGFQAIATTQTRVVDELCAQGGVEIIVSCGEQPDPAALSVPAGVGYVFASRNPLDTETVLACMRGGMDDCWCLPEADAVLKSQVDALLNREQNLLNQVGAELQDMRSEVERDQRAGQYIQTSMLPESPVHIGEFELAHRVAPSLFLSGDFIDYFTLDDDRIVFYVADVSGHGASSAMVTVLLKNFSTRMERDIDDVVDADPGAILGWINAELMSQQMNKHVAMYFGIVDTKANVLSYANAAQFPPAVVVSDGVITSLEQKGKPLGLFKNASFETRTVDFPPGARLVVFSDGVLDLLPGVDLDTKENELRQAIVANDGIEALWHTLKPEAFGHDDISCLLIERRSA